VATIDRNGIRIWNVDTGTLLKHCQLNGDKIVFTDDARNVAISTHEGKVLLVNWHGCSTKQILSFPSQGWLYLNYKRGWIIARDGSEAIQIWSERHEWKVYVP
jgi:hypothetical protein